MARKKHKPEPPEPAPVPAKTVFVDGHRKCRRCFDVRGGVGTAYKTSGGKRYYLCPECKFRWSHTLTAVPEVQHREPEELSER